MYKETLMKAIEHFHSNEMELLNSLWHDDLVIKRLYNNDIIVKGKEELTASNKPYMDKQNATLKVVNAIELHNFVIAYLEIKIDDQEYERVSVYEFIDGLIKNCWIAQFEKE